MGVARGGFMNKVGKGIAFEGGCVCQIILDKMFYRTSFMTFKLTQI